jgi:DNA-binding transcriptional ArsR family regulator
MSADIDEVDWERVGFVRASEYRTCILNALDESPATPTELSEHTDIEITHVSRTVSDLRGRNLVELLVASTD